MPRRWRLTDPADRLLDLFRPGRTIYLPGASGEILGLAERLAAEPERMRDVHIVSCLLPGFNDFDYAALHPTARVTTFLMPPALRGSFDKGRVRVLPLAYSGIATYIGERLHIDVALAHVSSPDAGGMASLGIAADFAELAFRNADITALVINPNMPYMLRGPRLSLLEADVVVELPSALVTAPAVRADAQLDRIASLVAEKVPDGASLQIGIGGAPAALWNKLRDHRDLKLASGLIAQDFRALLEEGAMSRRSVHRAGVAFGDGGFYGWLGRQTLVELAGAIETHGARALCATERFHAVNSALEVDLFGQANLEWRAGRLVSGAGGAPDFARGAAASPGGRSIVAMAATASRGKISRIVPRLEAPSVSLGRELADLVVTEHGVAELRDRSLQERAETLISVAAPEFREWLADQWQAMAKSL